MIFLTFSFEFKIEYLFSIMRFIHIKRGGLILTLFFSLFLFCSTVLLAQSKTVIYNEDAQLLNVSYMEIKPEHVVYQNPNIVIERNYRIFKKDLLLAFYPLGVYYVYDEKTNDLAKVPYIEDNNAQIDKIVTSNNKVIAGEIISIMPYQIRYFDVQARQEKSIVMETIICMVKYLK